MAKKATKATGKAARKPRVTVPCAKDEQKGSRKRGPKPGTPSPNKGKKKRRYSDDEKANALVALDLNGSDVKNTATKVEVPRTTLEEWSNGWHVHPDVTILRNEKKADMADRLEALVNQLIDAIPDKIDSASLAQAATAMGISFDKMRLAREQATSIAGKELPSDEQLFGRMRQMLEDARRRKLAALPVEPGTAGDGNGDGTPASTEIVDAVPRTPDAGVQ